MESRCHNACIRASATAGVQPRNVHIYLVFHARGKIKLGKLCWAPTPGISHPALPPIGGGGGAGRTAASEAAVLVALVRAQPEKDFLEGAVGGWVNGDGELIPNPRPISRIPLLAG